MPKLPPKALAIYHYPLLRLLDDEYLELVRRSNANAPRGGAVPVGGGEWMDSFLKSEAVLGTIRALREGKSIEESVAEGKSASEVAVRKWNERRRKDYQVRRWEGCCHHYLDSLIVRLRRR